MAGVKRGYAAGVRTMWWMLGLGAAIYAVMVFLGQDHGQKRQGLAGTPSAPAQTEEAAVAGSAAETAPAAETKVDPAPAPVAVIAETAPQTGTLQAAASITPADPQPGAAASVAIAPESLLQAGESLGEMMVVTARAAVVREGPGIQYKLVGRLSKDTDVQMVDRATKLVGWSVIQFTDGNGVRRQGFVASRLLGKKRS